MKVVHTVEELRQQLATLPRPLGLVPTMGALHDGHLTLARRAKAANASAAMTIFVNPTQFGPHEDFNRYPRPIERDLAQAEAAGVDLVFNPPVDQVYPAGFSTTVTVDGPSRLWEGERRPGHFAGVATVVARLLLLTGADTAYFGEKDYQQLQVIKRMVADLGIPTQIIGCATVREADGLAMSSRNVYLNAEERVRALGLSRALRTAATLAAGGERSGAVLEREMVRVAEAAGLDVDYLAIVDRASLEPLETLTGEARALGAVRLGPVRLIDNLAILPS